LEEENDIKKEEVYLIPSSLEKVKPKWKRGKRRGNTSKNYVYKEIEGIRVTIMYPGNMVNIWHTCAATQHCKMKTEKVLLLMLMFGMMKVMVLVSLTGPMIQRKKKKKKKIQ